MNTDGEIEDEQLNAITEKIIGCAFRVHNVLGCGFAEKVYENALIHELRKAGLQTAQQYEIEVIYDGVTVGKYFGDILVEGEVLVETKAVRNFDDGHTAQCLNYLAATQFPLCLLLNFGTRVEIKRFRRRQ